MTEAKPKPAAFTIFYDGGCPLCRREIAFYQGRNGAAELAWVDVSRAGHDDILPGLSRAEALARFHVLRPDGTLVSGGAAFAELWAALPGLRWAGSLMRRQPLVGILNRAYPIFLKLRPRLQGLFRRPAGA